MQETPLPGAEPSPATSLPPQKNCGMKLGGDTIALSVAACASCPLLLGCACLTTALRTRRLAGLMPAGSVQTGEAPRVGKGSSAGSPTADSAALRSRSTSKGPSNGEWREDLLCCKSLLPT